MIYEPNNKNIGTFSNKIKREAKLMRYICEKIDNSQDIKRLLYYNTLSPLSKKSRYTKEDEVGIVQPDIDYSLIDKNIIKAPFRDDIIEEYENLMFVWSPNSDYNYADGTMFIHVILLTPQKYNIQEYGDEDRNVNIAMRVADLLDSYTIDYNDGDIYESVGSVQFKLTKRFTERLAKSNDYILYGLVFEVDFITLRSGSCGY